MVCTEGVYEEYCRLEKENLTKLITDKTMCYTSGALPFLRAHSELFLVPSPRFLRVAQEFRALELVLVLRERAHAVRRRVSLDADAVVVLDLERAVRADAVNRARVVRALALVVDHDLLAAHDPHPYTVLAPLVKTCPAGDRNQTNEKNGVSLTVQKSAFIVI